MAAHILIVDDNELNLKLATKVLERDGYQISTALNGFQALALATDSPPDLAILDVMMPDMDGYELCARMRENPSLKSIPVIILTALSSVDDRLKAFDAGADDFLSKPFAPAELQARVKVLLRHLEARAEKTEIHKAHKVAVYSLRGGVGVSTLATNLAAGMTQLWGKESVLVDMALVNGQSALMLDLPIRNTWGDLAPIPTEEMDTELLEQVMLRHSSGTRVLAAPRSAINADLITEEKAVRVIELLEARYPYLIFDLPHDFSPTTLAALDAADKILMMLSPEMASVRSAGMALSVFEELGYPEEKIELVLNWNFQSQGLPRGEIETALKRKLPIVIPYVADAIVSAITIGKPPILNAPETALGALLEDLVYYWSEPEQKKKKPENPTEAWQRVAERARKRAKAAS
ncbi:MAG: response regulator [Anaerolineae bacterium]|jgi:pilus assembly protein CpaE|nr:response regulator [Anaerolineae bacterium]MBT7070843.1 response regulator [Anaerolineae bacterium]MBT7325420.1 response regulator [Anaerolineae bacterium]